MHFLSHLLAAKQDPYQEIGQIAGDFVRKSEAQNLDARIKKGYNKHFEIDQFTDSHEAIKNAKVVLEGPYRRYAGLTLDLYYDHLLAKNFNDFFVEDFEESVAHINYRLRVHEEFWPEPMRGFAEFMVEREMLLELPYRDVMYSGMKRITHRLRKRKSVDIDIDALVGQVFERQIELEQYFYQFMKAYKATFL